MTSKTINRTKVASLDGVLAVDKPPGYTSSEITEKVKRWGRFEKVGHTGTLDPAATGLLCLTLNRACRIAGFLLEGDKEYRGILTLGRATDTMDGDGKTISERDWRGVSVTMVEEAFQRFTGRITQKVPPFSAKKIRGVPMYRYARQGRNIDGGEKVINIQEFRIEEVSFPNVRFILKCSKGTYVRALCNDVGELLGCGAYLSSLSRVRTGGIGIEKAITMDEVKERIEASTLHEVLISPKDALCDMPEIEIPLATVEDLLWGKQLTWRDIERSEYQPFKEGNRVRITCMDFLVAVARVNVDSDSLPKKGGARLFTILRMLLDLKDYKMILNSHK